MDWSSNMIWISLSTVVNGWTGIARASNGKMYSCPCFAITILITDLMINTTATIPYPSIGSGTGNWYGTALGSNGKLYVAPSNVNSILMTDPN
jgi:hypothetical protein